MNKYPKKAMVMTAPAQTRIVLPKIEQGFSFAWNGDSHKKVPTPEYMAKMKQLSRDAGRLEIYLDKKYGSS